MILYSVDAPARCCSRSVLLINRANGWRGDGRGLKSNEKSRDRRGVFKFVVFFGECGGGGSSVSSALWSNEGLGAAGEQKKPCASLYTTDGLRPSSGEWKLDVCALKVVAFHSETTSEKAFFIVLN